MSILDPNWKYDRSDATNIRKLFRRERQRLKEQEEARAAVEQEQKEKVAPIKRKTGTGE